jgi:CBS domain-containing protein
MEQTMTGVSAQKTPSPLRAAAATVAEIMRPPLTTVNQHDHVAAAEMMTDRHFRHLPVAGDAGLLGVVDIIDVCQALISPGEG